MNKKAQGRMEGAPPSLFRGRLPHRQGGMSGKASMCTGMTEGAGQRQKKRLLIKGNAWRLPMPGTLEKGKSVAPKGQGKIMGKEGEERRNLLRAL